MASAKTELNINELPDEVLIEIFSYLPVADMACSSLVCVKWRDIFRRENSLWRHKSCLSSHLAVTRMLLTAGVGMPQLRTLQLLYDSEFGIHVAWPDVTVRLYVGAPLLWEPYLHPFNTDRLVVGQQIAESVSGYIGCADVQSLKKICVAEQHLQTRSSLVTSYFHYVPTSPHYSSAPERYTRATMLHSVDECQSRESTCDDIRHDSCSGAAIGDSGPLGSWCSSIPDRPANITVPKFGADGTSEYDAPAVCPALEVLNVHCKRLSQGRLQELCALGPLRILRIECKHLRDLSFLRSCRSHLEELTITDCSMLHTYQYVELRSLERLRVLHMSNYHLDESLVMYQVTRLPHLESVLLNGRNVNLEAYIRNSQTSKYDSQSVGS